MSQKSTAPGAPNSADPERIRRRHRALRAIREFFYARDFVEVDTPLLVPGPGLEPFIDALAVDVVTEFAGAPRRRWLITSPELALKRVVAGGLPRVFQLGHVFRDGERTKRHLPEFTMLEWYRAQASLDDLVSDHEALFLDVARALELELERGRFTRTTVSALFREHIGDDAADALADDAASGTGRALLDVLRGRGELFREGADFDDAFFHAMSRFIEPNIGGTLAAPRPIVVERWPACMAVLARRCDDDARFAERFEIYAGGLEISNAFDELTDPVEQRARFEADNAKRRSLGKPELPLDEEFLSSLSSLPRTAGCALGVDRLLMLLLQSTDIDEITALRWR